MQNLSFDGAAAASGRLFVYFCEGVCGMPQRFAE